MEKKLDVFIKVCYKKKKHLFKNKYLNLQLFYQQSNDEKFTPKLFSLKNK